MINSIDSYKSESMFARTSAKIETKQDFLSLLKEKLGDAVDQIHDSEKIGIAAATNQVDVHTLVTAFSAAEVNIRMLVTISEKLLAALQDVTKMQV